MLAGKKLAEPFIVCTNRDNSTVSYYDLERDGSTPILPVFSKENIDHNVGIGWKLKTEKTFFPSQYYAAFIHLGEQTGYKLISKQPIGSADITVAPGEELKWYWPMKEEGTHLQNNILLIVLQRTRIDAAKLEQALDKQFPPNAKKPLDVLQARDFLLPQFPGSYGFSYKSVFRESPCIKS
jgi:hypothetical protein